MEPPVKSAREYTEGIIASAHAKAGKSVPEDGKEPVPLVPIYIGVDREQPQEPLREVMLLQCLLLYATTCLQCLRAPLVLQMFLWRHGGGQLLQRCAANKKFSSFELKQSQHDLCASVQRCNFTRQSPPQ